MAIGIRPHFRVEIQEALLSLDTQLARDRLPKLRNVMSRSPARIDMFEPFDDAHIALAKPVACLPFGDVGDHAIRGLWRRRLSIGRLWANNGHIVHTQFSASLGLPYRIQAWLM